MDDDRDLKPDNSGDVLVAAGALALPCPTCQRPIVIRARRGSLWIRHTGEPCLGVLAWAGVGRLS